MLFMVDQQIFLRSCATGHMPKVLGANTVLILCCHHPLCGGSISYVTRLVEDT